MKTQLLQDFDESGSKAAAEAARAAQVQEPQQAEQPYAAPRAAVWQRRQAAVTPTQRSAPPAQSVQRAEPGMMGGATGAAQGPPAAGQMRPPGGQEPAQAAPSRQRAPEGAWTGPRPLPPDARTAATDAHARAQVHTQAPEPPPIHPAAAPDIPDWLSERLREDAEHEAQRQRSRVMARRALSWSAAATVVAMVAVAGYWFYQESRVEGALNVVANTSPAPGASVAPVKPVVPASAPATPAAAADRTASPVPQEPVANAAPPAAPVAAPIIPAAVPAPEAGTPEPRQAGAAQPEAAQDNIEHPAPHRKRHARPVTRAQAAVDAGPTPAQRREETLMQCRVLGYDARECTRRGCMMTRFGLACPG